MGEETNANMQEDELVIGISEAYAVARSFKEKQSVEVQRDFAATTEDFVRKNEKYFIKPEGTILLPLIVSHCLLKMSC